MEAERRELEEAARSRLKSLKALQEDAARAIKALHAERAEKTQLESRLAHSIAEVGSHKSAVSRLTKEVAAKHAPDCTGLHRMAPDGLTHQVA